MIVKFSMGGIVVKLIKTKSENKILRRSAVISVDS